MQDIAHLLDAIGLSQGEQAVYLGLLALGETTSGPLARKSGISASKVYQVIDRLVKKGLVGVSTSAGVKRFKASHPNALLDYLDQRRAQLDTLEESAKAALPSLVAQYEDAAQETEIQLLKGTQSLRNAFFGMLDELKRGGEYRALGANFEEAASSGHGAFFAQYHEERARRGVKAKLLFQNTKELPHRNWKGAQIKSLPTTFDNPLQINIYKDTTILLLMQREPLLFRITNRQIAESFAQYFDSLWNQQAQTWTGDQAIELLTDETIAEDDDLYLIGAHGYMPERHPETFARLVEGLKGHKRRMLSKENTKGKSFNEGSGVESHYLPSGFASPTVIWICGDIVAHTIWEETLTIFRIRNRKVADDYRIYYQYLKRIASR